MSCRRYLCTVPSKATRQIPVDVDVKVCWLLSANPGTPGSDGKVTDMGDPHRPDQFGVLWQRACTGSSCVEVALANDRVLLRNSTTPEGPIVVFGREEWRDFLDGVKSGTFDPP